MTFIPIQTHVPNYEYAVISNSHNGEVVDTSKRLCRVKEILVEDFEELKGHLLSMYAKFESLQRPHPPLDSNNTPPERMTSAVPVAGASSRPPRKTLPPSVSSSSSSRTQKHVSYPPPNQNQQLPTHRTKVFAMRGDIIVFDNEFWHVVDFEEDDHGEPTQYITQQLTSTNLPEFDDFEGLVWEHTYRSRVRKIFPYELVTIAKRRIVI